MVSMKRLLVVAALLGLAAPAHAAPSTVVTIAEVSLLAAAETSLLIDMRQTFVSQRGCNGGIGYCTEERNALLGKHPSNEKIAVYFAASMLTSTAAWAFLPSPWRNIVPIAVLVLEVPVIKGNIGPTVGWNF